MTATYYFRVAGFPFSVSLPGACDIEELLPSFLPFYETSIGAEEPLFRFFAVPLSQLPCSDAKELIDETDNDMGHLVLYALSDGYYIEIINNGHLHRMFAKSDFSSVEAHIQWDDVNAGNALSSLIRVAYAQAILRHDAVSIHASAVCCNGQAYLFLGKSGTGKSTHSALWIENIPGTELLNDDNPTIRILNGKAYAYGSPWSGKTACYKNVSFPVGGMVRLKQAPENSFQQQEGADAFVTLYPGCSLIARDEHLRNCLYDTLTVLAGSVTVGTLECLPDKDAAVMCNRELTRKR